MPKLCLNCNKENNDEAAVCASCFSPFELSADTLITDLENINDFSFDKGDLVAERYRIEQEISRGVLGILYEVKDTEHSDAKFYLKMLHPGWSSDPEAKKRFSNEITTCIDPVNPPQIQIAHLESGQDIYYYMTGPSLKQYQIERQSTTPPFSLTEIRALMTSLLGSLDQAHQYTVHNQISPENIIILGSFPNISIRLLNFCVGDDTSASGIGKTSPETASLLYVAPEQVKDPLAADLRADLYSVGVILYEMLTGEEAVGAFEMPSAFFSDIYHPLDEVIKKVLSSKADHRYSTALELSDAISSALTEIEEAKKKQKTGVINTPEKENTRINGLPGKIGLLHESRMFLVTFVAALLCLGGGSYILLNKDKVEKNTEIIAKVTDKIEAIDPIEPTDSRKKIPKDAFAEQEQNITTNSETEDNLPIIQASGTTTGNITISPSPANANIRILNIKPNYTPNMELEAGRYHLEVSAPGYEHLEQWIDLAADDNLNIKMVLQKSPEIITGQLTISPSPSNAKIQVLNIKSPYKSNMALAPGRYHIKVSAPGYESLTRWVDLAPEDTLDIAIALSAKEPKEKDIFIDPVTSMEFNLVKGDCYSIGQSLAEKIQLIDLRGVVKYEKAYSDETPQHKVCVDDFYIGKYEVTVKQWNIFIQETGYKTDSEKNTGGKIGCYSLKNNEWGYTNGRFWNNLGFPQSSNSPVACVSYNDVNEFIDWLNRKGAKQYRLPTEAEWEYAARGGTQSSRFWGDQVDKSACQHANVAYNTKSNNYFPCDDGYKWSSPVGSFRANNFGMHDMLGNMWEWCSDKYDSNYYSYSPRKNPKAASSGQIYTIRGGSWNGRESDIRAANRNWAEHDARKSNIGFRLIAY